MRLPARILAVFASLCALAFTGAMPSSGDFFVISRDRHGAFVGSHKLFRDSATGLNQVSYCEKQFFVRSKTVAWTEVESRRGHIVQIEHNFGRGWRPICDAPQRQVTLKDIGVDISAEALLEATDEAQEWRSRLSEIGTVFKQ